MTKLEFFIVLHPYYKLAYITLAWGGPEEQATEIVAGNPNVKDWQDEAKQIVKRTVSHVIHLIQFYHTEYIFKRWLSIMNTAHQLPLSTCHLNLFGTREPCPLSLCQNSTSTMNPCSLMIQRKAGPPNSTIILV